MIAAFLTVVALQGIVSQPARVDPRRVGTSALIDSLESAELRFFYEWRSASMLTADAGITMSNHSRDPATKSASELREGYILCWPQAKSIWMEAVQPGHVISSAASNFVACPSWMLGDEKLREERADIDASLDERFHSAVQRSRRSLVTLFDAAAQANPTNDWIVGQRVRLLVDQREFTLAVDAARQCRSPSRGWCAQLTGFALAMRGDIAAADSEFAIALQQMTPTDRCRASDVALLLDSASRAAYAAIPCARRDALNATFWWLSDPLYLDAGNARRVEHFARLVSLTLRSALARDERFDWRDVTGADAVREMIVRYGWPSLMWQLWYFDLGRNGGYLVYDLESSYATFEYRAGRLQTIPAWRAVADPLHARAADWAIADPMVHPAPVNSPRISRALIERAANLSAWWPQQHFAPRAPLVQLPEGQVALLRRQTNVLLATATDLASSTLARADGTGVDATLLLTEQPDSLHVVARGRGTIGVPLVLYGPIEPRPTLAAIEFPPTDSSGPPGGRTRFGIAPPEPLSTMKVGELAISNPVLLLPPKDGAALPAVTEDALAVMAGSARLQRGARLGLYWETYGFVPTDSVEIAVWVERNTPQGIIRRFGISLNIATDQNTPLVQSWTEARLGRDAHVISGPVPIIGRSLVLDASKLVPGEYWLDVVVRKAGSEPVRGRTSFIVPAR